MSVPTGILLLSDFLGLTPEVIEISLFALVEGPILFARIILGVTRTGPSGARVTVTGLDCRERHQATLQSAGLELTEDRYPDLILSGTSTLGLTQGLDIQA